jgi:hypothetical protein
MSRWSLPALVGSFAPVIILVLTGCATGTSGRTLDELSASYERLVAQAAGAQSAQLQDPSSRLPRQSVTPPSGSLGSAFLVVGSDALNAAAGNNVDPATRIALYRIAASSAHFVLVEEASTGRPATVEADAAVTPPAGGDPAQSGASIMLRAVQEAKPLCDQLQANRPPRDCAYLVIAASLADLAVVSAPWLFLPQPSGANRAQHIEAFARSPDDLFAAAWSAYQRDTGAALRNLGLASGQPAAAGAAVSGLADYMRNSDQRAFCVVAVRTAKVRALGATPIPGVDVTRNTDLLTAARTWYTARYAAPEPQCD